MLFFSVSGQKIDIDKGIVLNLSNGDVMFQKT